MFFPSHTFSNSSPLRWVSWNPLDHGYYKVNVNGASKGNPGPSAIGGICRNSSASVVGRFSMGTGMVHAIVVEALAIRFALIWAEDLGLSHIVVESDNLMLVNILNRSSLACPWRISSIVADCWLLQERFSSVLFRHPLQEGNVVADFLASSAATLQLPVLLFTSPPPSFYPLLLADCA
ncbi:uncharacterized protein LOC122077993 [Macadamia integrifolia]|uniref:uncharacterized protein LOC122077993 n=1 Tax=Macadamia integrifolia TaxID=60698 RepID=UPI001C4E56C0|nr:uncharacterized protein LOC122077993 [Macadamia integrifolia]